MRGCDLRHFKCEDEGAYLAYVTGCDLRHFKCEDEGAYLAYVTEIRDTQKGRKVRP